jgi:hypothetical protein
MIRTPPVAHSARWSLDGIRAALAGLMSGDFSGAASLVEAMLGDDRVLHCYQTIALEVTGRDLRFEPSKGADGRSSKAWTRDCAAWFPDKAMPSSATWDLIKWSEFLGVAVGQTTVLVEGGPGTRKWTPVVNVLPPHFLKYTERDRLWTYQTERGTVPVEVGKNGWFLFLPRGERGFVEGAVRAIAHPWLARTFARKDFSRWSELFGNGMIKARHPKDAKDAVVRRWLEGVRNLGREPVLKIPEGYDVELVMSTSSQADGFEKLLAHCDTAITLVLQGQTLTSGTAVNGNRNLGEVHRATANGRTIGRVRTLEQFERKAVLMPASDWNQGNPDAAPHLSRDVDPPVDEKASAEAFSAFVDALRKAFTIGLPVNVEKLCEVYGIDLDDAIDVATRLFGEVTAITGRAIRVDEMRERLGLEPLGDERGEKMLVADAPAPSAGGGGQPPNGQPPPGEGEQPKGEGEETEEEEPAAEGDKAAE